MGNGEDKSSQEDNLSVPEPPKPPAGWYPSPSNNALEERWDGEHWTGETRTNTGEADSRGDSESLPGTETEGSGREKSGARLSKPLLFGLLGFGVCVVVAGIVLLGGNGGENPNGSGGSAEGSGEIALSGGFAEVDQDAQGCIDKWDSVDNDAGRSQMAIMAQARPESAYVRIGPSESFSDLCEVIVAFPESSEAINVTENPSADGALFYPNPGSQSQLIDIAPEPVKWNAMLNSDGSLGEALPDELTRPSPIPAYCAFAWNKEANSTSQSLASDPSGNSRSATAVADPWFPDRCLVTVGEPAGGTATQFRQATMDSSSFDSWTLLGNPVPIDYLDSSLTDWNGTIDGDGLAEIDPESLRPDEDGQSLAELLRLPIDWGEETEEWDPTANEPYDGDTESCGSVGFAYGTDAGISNIQTDGMPCEPTRDKIAEWLKENPDSGSPDGEWSCYKVYRSAGMAHSAVTCLTDDGQVHFNWY